MKIISFSIWGSDADKRRPFELGAIENVVLAKIYYPGWTCLFYLEDTVQVSFAAILVGLGAQVQWRTRTRGDWEGLFWRFEPICDPFAECCISRDCDSRLNPREAAAVKEWLASGKQFHLMRDHHEHNTPILGGMFGSKRWMEFGDHFKMWTKFDAKGRDQEFLADRIWPLVINYTIGHDKYWNGLTMPLGGGSLYEYKPQEQLGPHDLREFPAHEPLLVGIHGEHVGARVGVDQ